MEIEINLHKFMTDSQSDMKKLANYFNGFNIQPRLFFIARRNDGSYYWSLKISRGDCTFNIFSIDFALVRNISSDIYQICDFFYREYQIELPFPRYEPSENVIPNENK